MPDIIDHSLEEVIPDPAHRQIFEEFRGVMNSRMPEINQISEASTQANTLIMWNDAAVYHERGSPRADLSGTGGKRSVIVMDVVADHVNPSGEPLPTAIASGAWVSRIDEKGKPASRVGESLSQRDEAGWDR
jgi:hypothetical protein